MSLLNRETLHFTLHFERDLFSILHPRLLNAALSKCRYLARSWPQPGATFPSVGNPSPRHYAIPTIRFYIANKSSTEAHRSLTLFTEVSPTAADSERNSLSSAARCAVMGFVSVSRISNATHECLLLYAVHTAESQH